MLTIRDACLDGVNSGVITSIEDDADKYGFDFLKASVRDVVGFVEHCDSYVIAGRRLGALKAYYNALFENGEISEEVAVGVANLFVSDIDLSERFKQIMFDSFDALFKTVQYLPLWDVAKPVACLSWMGIGLREASQIMVSDIIYLSDGIEINTGNKKYFTTEQRLIAELLKYINNSTAVLVNARGCFDVQLVTDGHLLKKTQQGFGVEDTYTPFSPHYLSNRLRKNGFSWEVASMSGKCARVYKSGEDADAISVLLPHTYDRLSYAAWCKAFGK